jgi:hypothetical protein
MQNKNDTSKLSLSEVASVTFFRSTPFHRFQEILVQRFRQTMLQGSCTTMTTHGDHGLTRYDAKKLRQEFARLDWKELCQAHDDSDRVQMDRSRAASSEEATQTTALSEILTVAMSGNATVVPHGVWQKVFLPTLCKAFLRSPRHRVTTTTTTSSQHTAGRWTPSQQLLLNGMSSHREGGGVGRAMYDFVHDEYCPSFQSSTPNRCNRLLSGIYWLVSRHKPNCEDHGAWLLIMAGLCLLQSLDDWDVQQQLAQEGKNSSDANESKNPLQTCMFCHGIVVSECSSKTREKYLNRSNLDVLHDGSTNNHSVSTMTSYGHHKTNHPARPWACPPPPPCTTTKICFCVVPRLPLSGGTNDDSYSVLSKDWSIVRTRAYKKFLSAFLLRQRQPPSFARRTDNSFHYTAMMHDLLHHSVARPHSPSLRVCLLLLAHSTDGGGGSHVVCHDMAKLCWQHAADRVSGSDTVWLRLYSEWIGECSLFDDAKHAWRAMRPLRCRVVKLAEFKERQASDEHGREGFSPLECTLLSTLSYLLVKRSAVLEKNGATKTEFVSFTRFLAVHFGDSPVPWLFYFAKEANNECENDRDVVVATLQKLNILGFVDDDTGVTPHDGIHDKDDASSKDSLRFKALQNWPFHRTFSVRPAVGRIQSSVLNLDDGQRTRYGCRSVSTILLSRPTFIHDDGDEEDHPKIPKKRSAVPILDHIQDDNIYCHIFSFCSFKRLGKLQQVCQTWKSIMDDYSESIWSKMYVSKFGMYKEGATVDGSKPWKTYFQEKHIVERSLSCAVRRVSPGGRNGPVYAFQTCSYLGCLHVLRSKSQEAKHYAQHELRKKAEEKRMQRAALAAAKTASKRKASTRTVGSTPRKKQKKSAR